MYGDRILAVAVVTVTESDRFMTELARYEKHGEVPQRYVGTDTEADRFPDMDPMIETMINRLH